MNKKKTEELKELAIEIKARLNIEIRHSTKSVPPPFIIEIGGHPSSGKSTIISKLDTSLRRLGFKVGLVQEGAQRIRNMSRSEPDYNRATALYSLHKLYEHRTNPSLDIVIFERCVFDSIIWPRYWSYKGKLSYKETVFIENFYLMDANKIDVAFFIVCDPNLSVERESKISSIDQSKGGTTNTQTIETLKKIFEESYNNLQKFFPQLNLLDTTNLTKQEMVDNVLEIILKQLAKKPQNSS